MRPTVIGAAEASSTVRLYDTDGTTVLVTTTGSGTYSIAYSTLSDGMHVLTVRVTDAAGNGGLSSAPLSLTVDAVALSAPNAPTLSAASDSSVQGNGITNALAPTILGIGAEANSAMSLYDTDGTTLLGTATADTGGSYAFMSATLTACTHGQSCARPTPRATRVPRRRRCRC